MHAAYACSAGMGHTNYPLLCSRAPTHCMACIPPTTRATALTAEKYSADAGTPAACQHGLHAVCLYIRCIDSRSPFWVLSPCCLCKCMAVAILTGATLACVLCLVEAATPGQVLLVVGLQHMTDSSSSSSSSRDRQAGAESGCCCKVLCTLGLS
jgi:hypothetical protein